MSYNSETRHPKALKHLAKSIYYIPLPLYRSGGEMSGQQREQDLAALRTTYQLLLNESSRLNILYSDVERSIETLETLSKLEKQELGPVILPIGAFLSIMLNKVSTEKVLIQMGANIYAEMSPDKAIEELKGKLEEIRKELIQIQVNLRQIEASLIAAEQGGRVAKRT
ncbi:MAG: hypothetical protein DSO07_03545 [Thermoproteota archaeon]|uniref:Prefoldin subunit alpha n=2 Tax=Candidatus Methanodesulfokora washburnensis TaxID=2478471 RepID=A0A520KKN7_9CREN|nr:MAG: hypothetical protein EF810_04200 [Candidatus Methanodesulfokores washburnensis]TDA41614.1 MAG: hypothetical protein DSO07_03545 [Candidatus Korarchaeota archaeon]